MKSLYIKSIHSFQEQPAPKPDATKILGPSPCGSDYECLDELVDEWSAKCQQLRTIVCRPGDVWEEGRIYEEGKDYRVSMDRPPFGGLCVMAIAPAPTDEAELWMKVFGVVMRANTMISLKMATGDWKEVKEISDNAIAALCKDYTLSRRSEQPEAVEFAEWIRTFFPHLSVENGQWCIESQISSAQLYQLFKQNK